MNNKVGQFLKMTMIGGLVVILPVALIVLLLMKAMTEVQKVLQPIVLLLPEAVILPKVMALLIVIGGCFLTGLVLNTRIGWQVYQVGERKILERIPGYTLLRSLVGSFRVGRKRCPSRWPLWRLRRRLFQPSW